MQLPLFSESSVLNRLINFKFTHFINSFSKCSYFKQSFHTQIHLTKRKLANCESTPAPSQDLFAKALETYLESK